MDLKFPYTLSDVHESASKKRFTVISTFSGGGGSSIGYKLAGGDVLVANEFVKTASDTYSANFPDTPVLTGDIRTLKGEDFLKLAGLKVGELDVLDGSPPCSAFSVIGKRETGWGQEKSYSDGKKVQNIEDLFLDFIRIANDIQPKIIIAENVQGIQFAKSRTKLNEFLNKFEQIGYVINFATINAKHYGTPQSRPRTIIIGVRTDIFNSSGATFPDDFFPEPLDKLVSIREAFEGLVQTDNEIQQAIDLHKVGTVVRTVMDSFPVVNDTDSVMYNTVLDPALTKNGALFFSAKKCSWKLPVHCLTATVTGAGLIHPGSNRKFTPKETYRLMGLPDDYKNQGTFRQQLERVGRMHAPFPVACIADHIVKTYLNR